MTTTKNRAAGNRMDTGETYVDPRGACKPPRPMECIAILESTTALSRFLARRETFKAYLQVPAAQVCPGLHRCPQAAQFEASVARSTHTPSQAW